MSTAPLYQVVNGLKFAPSFPAENIQSCLKYKAQSKDVFVVTYPKCGTTWTQQILILLMNGGQLPDNFNETGILTFSPFLELKGSDVLATMTRPFAIKTHLCKSGQPWHDEAKYVIVLRNPKDACVSFFYHHLARSAYAFDGTFHEFFPPWLAGEVECGSYFDWTLSWWPHRGKSNVHLTTYEAMKDNPREEITRMAKFLELGLSDSQVETVVEKSSFKSMAAALKPGTRGMGTLRKGIVGDWQSHFNEEENEAIKKVFEKKFAGTELLSLWNNWNIFPY